MLIRHSAVVQEVAELVVKACMELAIPNKLLHDENRLRRTHRVYTRTPLESSDDILRRDGASKIQQEYSHFFVERNRRDRDRT